MALGGVDFDAESLCDFEVELAGDLDVVGEGVVEYLDEDEEFLLAEGIDCSFVDAEAFQLNNHVIIEA